MSEHQTNQNSLKIQENKKEIHQPYSILIVIKHIFRWQPTRAPNPWEGILQATSHGPVCPQRFPVDMRSEEGQADALNRMPKQRLRQLQLFRSQLLRQSEDCLYLNIFVPLRGEKPINSRKRGKFNETIKSISLLKDTPIL